jgi:hypothetical protein
MMEPSTYGEMIAREDGLLWPLPDAGRDQSPEKLERFRLQDDVLRT